MVKKFLNNFREYTFQAYTQKALYVFWVAVFALVLCLVLFNNPYGRSAVLLPLIMLLFVAPMLLGVWWALGRAELSERLGRRALFVFMGVTAIVQLILGYYLCFTPEWDMRAIFEGGRLWALTGTFEGGTFEGGSLPFYFAVNPNQYGGLFLFRCIFSVWHFFGGTDFYMAAVVYNVLALQVMVFAVYFAVKRLIGVQGGVFSLFLLGIFLPVYVMGAAYYTDVLSLPFVACVFALYVYAKFEQRLWKRLALFAACGGVAAVGAIIKFPVVVVLIAAFFDLFLVNLPFRKRGIWRIHIACMCIAVCVASALFLGFRTYMDMDTKLDPQLIERYRLPLLHHMMMGLHGSGRYNHGDFAFTWSFPDRATRQNEVMNAIERHISDLGVAGMLRLAINKARLNFGDGTYALQDLLGVGPVRKNRLHEYVLGNGTHFNSYAILSTSLLCALYSLMLAGAACFIRKPGVTLVPWLSLLGLLLFLTFWETNQRYTTNFFPMLIIGASLGMSALAARFRIFR
jgi:4-amino-4-deoxy-L-arabinose transferase-like glycosyltransferase